MVAGEMASVAYFGDHLMGDVIAAKRHTHWSIVAIVEEMLVDKGVWYGMVCYGMVWYGMVWYQWFFYLHFSCFLSVVR